MTILEAIDLSHEFVQHKTKIQVLNNLNFSVNKGEFVALLGPSGCGKSTLFNIISGLITPLSGEIYLNGKRLQDNIGAFGYMQQKDLLLQWRTVLKNVLIGPEIQEESLKDLLLQWWTVLKNVLIGPEIQEESLKDTKNEALELLTQLGLQGFEKSYPMQLSGGMRQRVALVRTLLFKKDFLLLDEPFGALDAMTRTMMQSILLNIWNKERQTVLLITHDIEEALILADRIYVLTARPASIKAVVDVPLLRPRDTTVRDLIDLKSKLFELLKVEMQQVFDTNHQ